MGKIQLVLPQAHQNIVMTPGIEREMNDVQRELDDKSDRLKDGTINFIISKGIYKHEQKLLTVAAVIVNQTNEDLKGIKMDLKFALRNHPHAKLAPMKASLDEEFLGVIKNNQAFILHINVPAEDVGDENAVFQPNEMAGKIDNIEYHYISQ